MPSSAYGDRTTGCSKHLFQQPVRRTCRAVYDDDLYFDPFWGGRRITVNRPREYGLTLLVQLELAAFGQIAEFDKIRESSHWLLSFFVPVRQTERSAASSTPLPIKSLMAGSSCRVSSTGSAAVNSQNALDTVTQAPAAVDLVEECQYGQVDLGLE